MPASVLQASGTTREQQSVPGTRQAWLTSTNGDTVMRRVVSYAGESALIDPARMDVGTPYVFNLEGYRFVVFKRPDGAQDFYYLPIAT